MTRGRSASKTGSDLGLRWCALLLALLAATAAAAPPLPRELTLPPRAGQCDNLVKVLAPGGRCAAVSDVAGMLAVAHKPGVVPAVSLFALDEHGQPKSPLATTITLPRPAALGARANYPLALATHPRLPLLYVWQDIAGRAKNEPADEPKEDGFCHLLIYDLASGRPELVQSLGHGEEFARGNTAGSIAFDTTARRLFVPNLQRRNARGAGTPAIGSVRLNESGLADTEDADAALQITSAAGKQTAAEPAGLATAARRAAREAALSGKRILLPSRVRQATTASSATFAAYPCGLGFLPISDEITIVAGPVGPLTWDEGNRRAQLNTITFYPVVGVGYRLRLAGHPSLPVVFLSGLTSARVYRMEHVDGFLTLLPQRGVLEGASLAPPPVVMPVRAQFACGGANAIHLVGFDEHGALNGERTDVPVLCPSVEALAYSARYDKLYAAVDKTNP